MFRTCQSDPGSQSSFNQFCQAMTVITTFTIISFCKFFNSISAEKTPAAPDLVSHCITNNIAAFSSSQLFWNKAAQMAHTRLRQITGMCVRVWITLRVWGEISGDLVYKKQLFLLVLLLPPELLENPIGGFSLPLALFQTMLGKVQLEEAEPALVLLNSQGKLEDQIEDLFMLHFIWTTTRLFFLAKCKTQWLW